MPATKTLLLLSSLPASIVAAGEIPVSDPRPMLLWYVALAVPTLVSVAVGVLTIIEHFNRRGETAKAASLGGYVTHAQLNGELAKIYDAVKSETRALSKEIKIEFEKLDKELNDVTRTANQVAHEVANIEGRLEGRRRAT